MKYCKKCVQPDTRPGIKFDENGVCYPCKYYEKYEEIDWTAREKELYSIIDWAKKNKNPAIPYDCTIGVSGGKDSHFIACYVKEKLGLRPLLVNYQGYTMTEIGRQNLLNLQNLGFDCISIKPNPNLQKKLAKIAFYKFGNPIKPSEYPLKTSYLRIAMAFDIRLNFLGENAGITLGDFRPGEQDFGGDASCNADGHTVQGGNASDWLYDDITLDDLYWYQHPSREELKIKNLKSIYLGYYVKEYSAVRNAEFAIKRGFKGRTEPLEEIGRYRRYTAVDDDTVIVNQLLKYIKFGFGYATDEACYDIREGRITREEGIELVRKYDGKCHPRYIEQFCRDIEITVDEFWRVANSFRGNMWRKNSNGEWELIEPIWEQEK
ncbi:MAG TPA: N-acetyl sugar amidotransferase [bacterium]|mgnify:CR=1 FL=1|nr:N-acetyl sugar amidotransferase [bacterium]HOL47917.1 N-acetyl sugar amidotransferase [bacterium]